MNKYIQILFTNESQVRINGFVVLGRRLATLLYIFFIYSRGGGGGEQESPWRAEPPDRIWRAKIRKVIWFDEIRYSGAYGVADYESKPSTHLDKYSEIQNGRQKCILHCIINLL